jgi:dipeptidyl aminopeptidase/acylaminoacyl peptidase
VLKRAALLALVLLTAGCGSVERTGGPEPQAVERHLVYEKVIGEKGIWIAEVDGSRPRLLVPDGRAPAISPDGRWVAYVGDCDPLLDVCRSAYVASTAGGKPRLFARRIWAITWAPDSKRVVATRGSSEDDPGRATLLSIDVASGEEVELAEGKFWGWSVSPDGNRIVFARLENQDAELLLGTEVSLFVADLDGGDAKRLTDTGDAAEPVWGPKSIAFAKLISCLPDPDLPVPPSGCRNRAWGRHEIWQIQPDGSARRTITGPLPDRLQAQGFTGLIPIDWSDDGQAMLGGWTNEWAAVAMAVDPESGKAVELDPAQGSDPVALSGDGRFALVDAGGGAETSPEEELVLIYPYGGGKGKVVARGAAAPSWNR